MDWLCCVPLRQVSPGWKGGRLEDSKTCLEQSQSNSKRTLYWIIFVAGSGLHRALLLTCFFSCWFIKYWSSSKISETLYRLNDWSWEAETFTGSFHQLNFSYLKKNMYFWLRSYIELKGKEGLKCSKEWTFNSGRVSSARTWYSKDIQFNFIAKGHLWF